MARYMGPYHASRHLEKWLRCPLYLKLQIDMDKEAGGTGELLGDLTEPSWAMMFGNIVHDAVDDWHRSRAENHNSMSSSLNDQIIEHERNNAALVAAQTDKKRLDEGVCMREAAAQYVNLYQHDHDLEDVWTEVACKTSMPHRSGVPVEFRGTIDQIRVYGGERPRYVCVDIKTGKGGQADPFSFEALRRSYQLWLYAHAIERGEVCYSTERCKPHGNPLQSCEQDDCKIPWIRFSDWNQDDSPPLPGYAGILKFRSLQPYKVNCKGGKKGDMRGDPWRTFQVTEAGLDSFEKRAMQIVSAIRMNVFPPNPNACTTCDINSHCALKMGMDLTVNDTVANFQNVPGINI